MANETGFSNEKIKQVFFILIIVAIGYLLYQNLKEFLPALLGAITIYILCRKIFFRLTEKWRWHSGLTAANIILLSLLILVLPISTLINMLGSKANQALQHKTELLEGIKSIADKIKEFTSYDVLGPDAINKIQKAGTNIAPQLFGATFNTISVVLIMFFILYFMLTNGRKMEEILYNHIPLKENNVQLISHEVQNMVMSNAIGIPIIAILQSVVALVGYFIFGISSPWFWFVITCFTSMIPVVGSTIVWLPLAVQLLVSGNQWQGVGLLIWGVVAVGTADNLFRILLSKKIGDTHPLISIFGVIVGVKLYGFIGLIFGPLLITLFILLIRIYDNEYFFKKKAA